MSNVIKPEVFYPSEAVIAQANVSEYEKMYEYSVNNREEFWAEQAENLSWYKKWDSVLNESEAPH
jgi:acetyl-CoA synthetase